MPNWCTNAVEIYGDKADVKALADLLKTGETAFDFNLFIPYPVKYAILDEVAKEATKKLREKYKAGEEVDFADVPMDGYNQGGYDWCCKNWGTKWNAFEPLVDIDSHGEAMTICLDTAWSPPIPVIAKLSEMFPKLTINLSYREEGMCFEGSVSFHGGERVSSEEHTLEPEEEEEWEEEDEGVHSTF